MNPRDLILRRKAQQARKANVKPRYRAVLCAVDGSRTSGSVWANEDAKLVYFQFWGSGGVGYARCEKLVPELGLGVYVGPTDDDLGWQVLEDDPLLRKTATDNRNYQTVAAYDLQPGGRIFMWLYSKALLPLATFPNPTGLAVNVVGGDYPYGGVRKTLVNQFNIALTQNPNPGEHYYAGLYIDSANAVQVVYGASVATSTTPPEPSWPAGAFRLSVVRINDTQTSIAFLLDDDPDNDVFDRRMLWSDEQSGGVWLLENGGPIVQYTTLAAALAAAAASGDTIWLGPGTYTEQNTVSKSVTIIGTDPLNTIITFAGSASYTLYLTTSGIRLENLTIANTGAGAASGCIQADDNDIVLRNCIINKTSGAATTSYGVWVYGGSGAGIRLEDCRVSVTAGTTKNGIMNSLAAAVITVEGGQIGGDTADISGDQAGSTLNVYDPVLTNGYTSWAGDVSGQYFGTKLVTNASGATAPGRDAGYINTDGDYVTTTTANTFTGSNCVVVVSGGNTKKCFVATAGRWPVRYTGSAPNDGDFLVTSTTAGAAAAQATMRPEIFARCQAGGASNVVTALLLTGTEFVAIAPATLLYSNTAGSDTSFTATINGSPSATSVVYNAPSAGSADVIKPGGSGQLFKAVLHNTTRGTSRLIDDVNTGTNTITTISSTDAWASGDTITIQSQVVSTGGSPFAVDLDGSQDTNVPLLAREVMLEIQRRDSTLPANVAIHPHETYSSTKLQTTQCQVANTILSDVRIFPLINRRFDMINNAGGSATADVFIKVFGYFAASP